MSKKIPRILVGLRRLSKELQPGETLTVKEIAKECGVSERCIQKIEQKATARMRKKLGDLHTLQFS